MSGYPMTVSQHPNWNGTVRVSGKNGLEKDVQDDQCVAV